jgi:hypothetical protein
MLRCLSQLILCVASSSPKDFRCSSRSCSLLNLDGHHVHWFTDIVTVLGDAFDAIARAIIAKRTLSPFRFVPSFCVIHPHHEEVPDIAGKKTSSLGDARRIVDIAASCVRLLAFTGTSKRL